jgi:addiction module HigA family antidote
MVLRRLAGRTEATAPVLTLVTQFGGGKTHTLTALYHLLSHAARATRFVGVPDLLRRASGLPPIHPGEILREDFMVPLGISMNKLALDLHVPVTRIAEIVHERRGITPDTALRLGRYFNISARFWLNAQAAYDLEVAQDKLQDAVEREVRPRASLPPGSKAAAKA